MSTSARPVSPESSATSLDDIFASVAREAVEASASPPDDTTDESSPSAPEDTAEAPVEEPSAAEAEAPETVPDGYVPVPKIERPLVTEFTIHDAAGEIEPPDLKITYQANGKTRTDSLDQVVKLAQWGVHNAERYEQAQAAFAEAQTTRAALAETQAKLAQAQQAFVELMQSDEKYLDAREAYEKANSPEARLATQQAELAEKEAQIAFNEAAALGRTFMESKLDPAIATIVQTLPTVTEEELAARLLLHANRFTVHTKYGDILPPQSHAELSRMVLEELVPWAQETHRQRMAEREQITAQAKTQVQQARAESQKSKNLAAKGMRPIGKAAPATPQRRAPRNVDEAHDEVVRATLEAMR